MIQNSVSIMEGSQEDTTTITSTEDKLGSPKQEKVVGIPKNTANLSSFNLLITKGVINY